MSIGEGTWTSARCFVIPWDSHLSQSMGCSQLGFRAQERDPTPALLCSPGRQFCWVQLDTIVFPCKLMTGKGCPFLTLLSAQTSAYRLYEWRTNFQMIVYCCPRPLPPSCFLPTRYIHQSEWTLVCRTWDRRSKHSLCRIFIYPSVFSGLFAKELALKKMGTFPSGVGILSQTLT